MLRLEKGQAGWSVTNNRPLLISLYLPHAPSYLILLILTPFPPPATLTSHPPSFNHDTVCSSIPPPPPLPPSPSTQSLQLCPLSPVRSLQFLSPGQEELQRGLSPLPPGSITLESYQTALEEVWSRWCWWCWPEPAL